jgi:hypothetical protein
METLEPCLPIWCVTGSNWTAEVQPDDFDTQFGVEEQMLESASRCVEIFEGLREPPPYIKLNPESKDEQPQIGTTMLCHLKGSDPGEAAIIFSHVVYADCGLYEKSKKMFIELEKQLAEIKTNEAAKQAQAVKDAQDLKAFQQLKADFPPTPPKKPKKPKKNP